MNITTEQKWAPSISLKKKKKRKKFFKIDGKNKDTYNSSY